MRSITKSLIALAAVALVAGSAQAQTMVETGKGNGGSPHVKVTQTVAGANLVLEYGRPSLKGRPEATLMPAGKPWRTGADQATLITTDKTLTFGTVTLAPGSYTINTEPGEKGWTLILGKLDKPGQWGIPYVPALELGRAPMALGKTKAPVETLTIAIDGSATGGTLRVEWGSVSATSVFTVAK
jgi:hypothetical protein